MRTNNFFFGINEEKIDYINHELENIQDSIDKVLRLWMFR